MYTCVFASACIKRSEATDFCTFLCTKINFEAYLTLFPKLSEAPYPPRVLQNSSKKALRHVGSGLNGVEKLEFWQGIEPGYYWNQKEKVKNNKMLSAGFDLRTSGTQK